MVWKSASPGRLDIAYFSGRFIHVSESSHYDCHFVFLVRIPLRSTVRGVVPMADAGEEQIVGREVGEGLLQNLGDEKMHSG